ncbi:MAG TPA: 4-alpha-glucanotransferase [Pseudonocardiaceae bacterium]|nr:4-alpha-glucanotransferase [Pseudonocardiaceae bacterium]
MRDAELAELAGAHGVAIRYANGDRQQVEVDDAVVAAVLGQLGVDTSSPAAIRRELAEARRTATDLPATIVLRLGATRPLSAPGEIHCEDGTVRAADRAIPVDLPLGYHRLRIGETERTLIVVPDALAQPPRTWGWMVQLYALHSTDSWGIGDYADLRELAEWSGSDLGAGVLLVNPLHAPTPVLPVEASPYAPSSRRFANPLYLRIQQTAGYQRLDADTRRRVDALRPVVGDRIDYDGVFTAKQQALALVRAADLDADAPADPALTEFATFCALAERHGRHWRDWPAELRHPDAPAVAALRTELADRVGYHAWLQRLCAQQLGAARQASVEAGMAIGIVHDLAVGIDPNGADAWALQDVLATGATVGAPPDAFNQRGQDWQLSPWHPARLAEAGYQPYRDVVRAALRNGGGLRVDHVAGLWRLWWVPTGEPADRGTYVHYDAEAMFGVLALEAARTGGVVIGEDLGTVEPEVSEGLRDRNALGCAVLWFENDQDDEHEPPRMLAPAKWPERATASISTHDLPTAAGFLRAEHVRVRAALGQLTESVEAAEAAAALDRRRLLDLLADAGLIGADPTDEQLIVAMHQLLASTPCRLHLVSPYDVIGEIRQPNLPGTIDQYPNWRLPLSMPLEEFRRDQRVQHIVDTFRVGRPT